jgi:hypothetical protein
MKLFLHRIALSFLTFWILINFLYWLIYSDEIDIGHERFLNLKSCPFCFGYSLCGDIQFENSRFDFQLDPSGYIPKTYQFQEFINIKNVFYLNDRLSHRKLILKKLAYFSELEEFDERERKCSSTCIKKFAPTSNRIDGEFLRNASQSQQIDVLSCFSDRLARLLVTSYTEHDFSNDKRNNSIPMLTLLSTLKINPEPVILQVNFKF